MTRRRRRGGGGEQEVFSFWLLRNAQPKKKNTKHNFFPGTLPVYNNTGIVSLEFSFTLISESPSLPIPASAPSLRSLTNNIPTQHSAHPYLQCSFISRLPFSCCITTRSVKKRSKHLNRTGQVCFAATDLVSSWMNLSGLIYFRPQVPSGEIVGLN
jgi:hypothetical protein